MGFIGHGISVYDELSALENLTLFGKLYGLADPKKSAARMAGAHRPGARPQRPGAGVFARHAAASGGGPRVPPRTFGAAARRTLHGARRPRHRRPAAPAARSAGGRQNHRHVHPPVAGSAGTRLARRAVEPRTTGLPRRAHARKWWTIPATSTHATARADEIPSPDRHRRGQGPARRTAHQGSAQRLAGLRADDPAALQLHLRPIARR